VPTEDDRLNRMHRVLQAVVVDAMSPRRKASFDAALLAKATGRAGVYENRSIPPEWVWEARMLGVLAGHWLPQPTADTARLASAAATGLVSLGDMNTARRIASHAETIRKELAQALPDDVGAQRD